MYNLGNVLIKLGNYALAKNYLEKALVIKKKHHGPTHPHTARTMVNLGIVCYHLGQYTKAKEYYQSNIKLFTEHYGANHAETKRIKRNLAILEKHLTAKSKQKQPKAPKIDQAKQQEIALIQATCHFVEAMKRQPAKTSVPASLGSSKWDANAVPTFVAAVLRMCRKRQYPHALSSPERYGIPASLVPFIKAYLSDHPQLQQVVKRPDFCKSHLEKPLILGQIDQLYSQFQSNEEKEVGKQDNGKQQLDHQAKVNKLVNWLPLLQTHKQRAEALYIKLRSADTPQKKLQLANLSAKRTQKEKFASWISSKADKLNHVWVKVDNEDYLPLLNKLKNALLAQIAAPKKPKANLGKLLKNDGQKQDDEDVFDID